MATGSRHSGPTTTETRLVEQYVSVLDYVSRCAQAIDHGDWFYLYDKADTLAEKAGRARPRGLRRAPPAPRRGGGGGGGLAGPSLPGREAAAPTLPPRRWAAMKLRLHGTPSEVAAALARLRACFEVTNESRPYPDRPLSRLVRVYLDLGPLPAAPDDAS
jgi:hypothetical protein